MRTPRCPTTQKEIAYENVSCFNLQSYARVCGRRCARRKQIKEASEEKTDAISAARSRAERRTTENKRVTAGDYGGGTRGGGWSTEDEKGKRPAAGNYRGRWSTEDEKGKGPAAGDYRGRWSTENEKGKRPATGDYGRGTSGGCWKAKDETEDESVTTDRYTGWADS